jgi:hypothetical protein
MVMLRFWLNNGDSSRTGNALEHALHACGRQDIVQQCMINVEEVTDERESMRAKSEMEESGFMALKEELGPSRDSTLERGSSREQRKEQLVKDREEEISTLNHVRSANLKLSFAVTRTLFFCHSERELAKTEPGLVSVMRTSSQKQHAFMEREEETTRRIYDEQEERKYVAEEKDYTKEEEDSEEERVVAKVPQTVVVRAQEDEDEEDDERPMTHRVKMSTPPPTPAEASMARGIHGELPTFRRARFLFIPL